MRLFQRLVWWIVLPVCTAGCGQVTPQPLRAGPPRSLFLSKMMSTSVDGPSRAPVSCPARFVDVASKAGLNYRWTITDKRPLTLLGSIGNGCAFVDYDNSGNLSILLVGNRLALFKGDGHGHFVDVTHAVGLDDVHGHFLGCAIGDYDNDGYDDIYLTGYHTGVLLHNEHGRFFKDVTASSGLKPQEWGTSAAFVDVDGDGYLDLYVADYVDFDSTKRQLCPERGVPIACGPHYYKPLYGVLYRNVHGTRFVDATRQWGASHEAGNGLGVAVADFEGTGHPGFAVANDELMTDLFRSDGAKGLSNIGVESGVFADKNGHVYAGMGIDWGDFDNDGREDLFVATYGREVKCLYHNEGDGLFSECSEQMGVAKPLYYYLSFGCKFIDADNDGWLDLLVASGHTADDIAKAEPFNSYRQATEFLHSRGANGGGFDEASTAAGLSRTPKIVGRGLAVGDFDNDGRVDALVVDSEGAPLLLHNETRTDNHWLGLRLTGTGRSNRDAYGSIVTVTLDDGEMRLRECEASGSYLSSSDKRVVVGLGVHSVKSISVRWPDGRVETRTGLGVDRYVDWVEGRSTRSAVHSS